MKKIFTSIILFLFLYLWLIPKKIEAQGAVYPISSKICQTTSSFQLDWSGSGSIVHWEVHNGSGWSNIATTNSTITVNTPTAGTYKYRTYVDLGGGTYDYSINATVTVYAQSAAGAGVSISYDAADKCINDNTGTVQLGSGYTGTLQNWVYSFTGNSPWLDVGENQTTLNYNNLGQTTYYKALIKNDACPSVLSTNTATITILDDPDAGNVSIDNTKLCEGTTTSLRVSSNTGTSTNWQENSGVWSNIGTGTVYSISPNPAVGTHSYRLNVGQNCKDASNVIITKEANSNTLSLEVYQNTTAIDPTGTAVVSNNDATIRNVSVTPVNGTVVRWEYSPDNSQWTPLTNTSNTLSYSHLTSSTYYRAVIQNGVCSEATSNNAVKIYVADGGTISTSTTDYCSPSSAGSISLSGQEGTTWTWEYSVNPFTSWTALTSDVNLINFNNLTETTKYRVNVNSGKAFSNTITINIAQASVAGSLSTTGDLATASNTVCKSDATNRTISLTGNTGNAIRWESSLSNSSPWNSIQNTTSSLTFNNLNTSTYYRAIVKNGVCSEVSTSGLQIKVAGVGAVNQDMNVCTSDATNRSVSLSGNIGTVNNWESSKYDAGSSVWGAWSNIGNAGNTNHSYSNLTKSTRYRAVINTACASNPTSGFAEITVFSPSIGGSIGGSKTVKPADNSGSLSVTGPNGDVLRWESSFNGKEPWMSISNTSSSLIYNDITQTTYYRTVIQNGPCPVATSSTNGLLTVADAGEVSQNMELCASDATVRTLNLQNYVGTISRWQKSTDGTNYSDITGTSGQDNLSFSNLTQTIWYRVAITEDGGDIFSQSAKITIDPLPQPSFSANQACYTHISSFTNTSTIASGNINNYEWNFGDGASSILNAPSHTFSAAGNYSVTLKLKSDKLCENSITTTVTVKYLPSVDFVNNNVCDQNAVSFTNNSSLAGYTLTYQWKFGDGNDDNAIQPSHTYGTFGNYEVTLVVTANGDCMDSTKKTVTIYENPSPDFSSVNICDGQAMQFTNKSYISDGNLSYNWDFNDASNTSNKENPSYTFSTANTYNIQLTATSSNSCSKSVTKSIQVYSMPVANFSVSDNCYESTTTFTDSSTVGNNGTLQWNWNFKDGNSSTTQSPTHSYSAANSYVVKLTVTSDNSCVNSIEKEVIINPVPKVNFTFDNICTNDTARFSNYSNIASGTLNYQWSFGNLDSSSVEEPTELYSASGNYDVTLKLTSNNSCSAELTKSITIYPNPVSNFTAADVCFKSAVNFVNSSTISGGSISDYFWDFGDGNISILENSNLIYEQYGTYTVNLTTTSDKKCKSSFSRVIAVNQKTQPAFTQTNVCASDTMKFVNTTTGISGTPVYNWNFGDGIGASTSSSPNYIYTNDGKYNVSLTITNGNGCSASITNEVEAYIIAKADFTYIEACEGSNVQFTNTSSLSAGAMSYTWDFGNTKISNNTDPTTNYTNWGTYPVKLTVTTDRACKNEISKTITIHQNPTVNFFVENKCYGFSSEFQNLSKIQNGNLNYEWQFGDKQSATDANPKYSYKTPGLYEVFLTATSDFGCSATTSSFTEIYPKPYASFNSSPICVGNEASFDNVSNIEAGTMTYAWDFGNGQISNIENPKITYLSASNFTVSLTATSNYGCINNVSKSLSVYHGPTPDFDAAIVCDGYPTKFSNKSTIGEGIISYYQWNFGDLSNSLQENPIHQFFDAGTYDVSLLVKSDKGCQNSITIPITVDYVPIANFSSNATCLNSPMLFNDNSYFPKNAAGSITYKWDMGDNNSYNVQEPQHIYDEAGIYLVQLKVTSSQGLCADSITKQVIVRELPMVNAGVDTIVPKGYPIVFNAVASQGTYIWSPSNDLDNPFILNPACKPTAKTEYILQVTNGYGCVNSDSLLLDVDNSYELYQLDFSASNIITPDNNGENDTWVVPNITFYETNHVKIFNRWGKEIYSVVNYQNDWNGTNKNGDILPDGTYYYVIYFDDSNVVLKGAISLLRKQ